MAQKGPYNVEWQGPYIKAQAAPSLAGFFSSVTGVPLPIDNHTLIVNAAVGPPSELQM